MTHPVMRGILFSVRVKVRVMVFFLVIPPLRSLGLVRGTLWGQRRRIA